MINTLDFNDFNDLWGLLRVSMSTAMAWNEHSLIISEFLMKWKMLLLSGLKWSLKYAYLQRIHHRSTEIQMQEKNNRLDSFMNNAIKHSFHQSVIYLDNFDWSTMSTAAVSATAAAVTMSTTAAYNEKHERRLKHRLIKIYLILNCIKNKFCSRRIHWVCCTNDNWIIICINILI